MQNGFNDMDSGNGPQEKAMDATDRLLRRLHRTCRQTEARWLQRPCVAETCADRMVVEAIGRSGRPVRFTVKRENLAPLPPGLFDQN